MAGAHRRHSAIAAFLRDRYGVDSWWAQSVTVGYERITGLRLPYQEPDGPFSAAKSRTMSIDSQTLREMLLDERDRADLFPGLETQLRSRPTSNVVRIAIGPGIAQIALDTTAGGRVRVAIAHEKLPSPEEVERWKTYWAQWLDALDENGGT